MEKFITVLTNVKTKKEKNKPAVNLKTGRFDNINSAVIISSVCVLYCLAYTADDDSWIYVVEMSSFEIYSGFIFPP